MAPARRRSPATWRSRAAASRQWGKAWSGQRDDDADGLLVTPGWVDVHTHYDGQAMWDPLLAPSCWHGVTTVMFGNCGVGFAPVKKEHRGALMDLMEGVEEIPNPVLAAGLNWEWETFPQYMDELDRRPRAIDVAAQIAHLPLRVHVMGDRAVRREAATSDDVATMRDLTVEALRSGAFGFTTSRTDSHKTPDGDLVPSRDADDHELLGIGSAMSVTGTGAFGMNSDFDDEEFELRWMRKLAKDTGRPVWFLLTDRFEDPERWRRLSMKAVHEARAQGLPLTAQMAGRPIGVRVGIGTALNPFTVRPTPQRARKPADRGAASPAARSRDAAENPGPTNHPKPRSRSSRSSASSSPSASTSSSSWATRRTTSPARRRASPPSPRAKAARPTRLPTTHHARRGASILYFPVVNYVTGDHELILEMLNDPACLLGLSDGGAHCASIVDGGLPSFIALTHWGARDRSRGPRLLEPLVKRQCAKPPISSGLHDRRPAFSPGLRADVNLIDFDALKLHKPELVHDMPADGRRFHPARRWL